MRRKSRDPLLRPIPPIINTFTKTVILVMRYTQLPKMKFWYADMTTDERLIVGNYVHKHRNEDAEVSAQKLLPRFEPKYDYSDVLNEVRCWRLSLS